MSEADPTRRQQIKGLVAALDDLQAASDAADEANGTSEYQVALVAIALIARHFLREHGATVLALLAPREPTP